MIVDMWWRWYKASGARHQAPGKTTLIFQDVGRVEERAPTRLSESGITIGPYSRAISQEIDNEGMDT